MYMEDLMIKIIRKPLYLLIVLIISGCGGGSDNKSSIQENRPPVANPDSIIIDEDSLIIIDVLENDTDSDGDKLSVTSATALNGSVTINEGKTLSYTPNLNFNGEDTISYVIEDGNEGVAESEVVIKINAVNDRPIAIAGENIHALVSEVVELNSQASTDQEGDDLFYEWSVLYKPVDSLVQLDSAIFNNPSFVPDQMGVYVFQLVVNDGQLSSAADQIVVLVSDLSSNTEMKLVFDQQTLNISSGDNYLIRVSLDADILSSEFDSLTNGLFSYGVLLRFPPGAANLKSLDKIVVPPELDFNGISSGAFKNNGQDYVGVKGNVDLNSGSLYNGSLIAEFTMNDSSVETFYYFTVELFRTLGQTESLFINGDGEILDSLIEMSVVEIKVE